MSHNTFGHLFRVTTWGESHGPALGCVIDGVPPGIRFLQSDIQWHMDRRRPGRSRFVSSRKEQDEVLILSGVIPDDEEKTLLTTGTPISIVLHNKDAQRKDYTSIAGYRPGHSDYTYDIKYGLRDHFGGGRASGRETAMRVAAGALARKIVPGLRVQGALIAVGEKSIDRKNWDADFLNHPENPFFTPDSQSIPVFQEYLEAIQKKGSSVGALVEIIAEGVPPGLGAPVYAKLDQDIAGNIMSINAVKGVEIGKGFECVKLQGEENNDEIRTSPTGETLFLSNNSGGILGGISTGQPIVIRFAVKPASSVSREQLSINERKENVKIAISGRHDPCIGIRAVPVGEAMVACAIADHYLRHRGQTGRI